MRERWLRRGGGAALAFAFWAVVALESITWRFYATHQTSRPVELDFIVLAEILMFGIAAALTPFVLLAARRIPLAGGRWLVGLAAHLVFGAAFALGMKLLWDFAVLPFYATPWIANAFSWSAMMKSLLLQGFQANFLLYWVLVAGVTAIDHARRCRDSLTEASELRAQLAEAQLESIRKQLDPHFLFNTLHSISALAHSDPDAAESTIADLSELLRRSLEHRDRHEIPLREEIEFLGIYLAIQCRRFEERLAVRFRIDGEAGQALIPDLLLQPLVENSIRHAIGRRACGGTILVNAGVAGGVLALEVEDRGGSPACGEFREGIGLRATRERLERMYGADQSLEIRPAEEGLLVRIRIPFRTEETDAGNHAVGRDHCR